MKIICAGISKTGTKSLSAALKELGYAVIYDFMEHFWEHGDYWKNIFEHGSTEKDFKEMYKNVDVVMDVPVCSFWEEVCEAFPEAKIILTIRDEDKWVEGLHQQNVAVRDLNFFQILMAMLCPTSRRLRQHAVNFTFICFGVLYGSDWKPPCFNRMLMRKKYREHNSYVLYSSVGQVIGPKPEDGWDPLCKFLGKDVPQKPYPWQNKKGSAIEETLKNHPFMRQVKKEGAIILASFTIFISIIVWW